MIQGKVFTIKETYYLDHLLGGNFERVKDPKSDKNIITLGSNIYFKRMMENFKNTFWFEPTKQRAAMTPDYNPEI